MVFSLFGRKDKAEPVRKEPDGKSSSSPTQGAGYGAVKPSGTTKPGSAARPVVAKTPMTAQQQLGHQAHAAQVVQRINAIESEMDTGADLALQSRPVPFNLPSAPSASSAALSAAGLDAPRRTHDHAALDFLPSNIPTNMPTMEPGASTLLGDSINALAVEIEGSRIAPEIEEAAILYANNQADAAIALLQHVAQGDNASHTQQAWALLFDLFQFQGKQAEFDNLSIDYAARFESSPPAWNELDAPSQEAPKASNPSVVIFPELFDANGMKQVDAVQRAAQRGRAVTLDFSQLKRVDANGAQLLNKIIAAFCKGKLELVVHHARRLLAAAEAGVEVGRRDASDAVWLLRLDALRLLDMQQAFDDVAIDLCVTYEISPPAWQAMPSHVRAEETGSSAAVSDSVVSASGPQSDRFVLAGEAVGAIANELNGLNAFAEPMREVMLDCRRLRRIDFVAAGNLMNMLVNLRQKGKVLTIYEPNNLVLALFSAMGLNEVASIQPRKF